MSGRNHSGFSLIEALVAVAIAALIMTAIFGLQDTIVQSVGRASRHFDAIAAAYQVLVADDVSLKAGVTEEKKEHTVQGMTMQFQLGAFADNSPFGKLPDLYQERVTVSWTAMGKKRTETLVTFVYRPEKKQSDTKIPQENA